MKSLFQVLLLGMVVVFGAIYIGESLLPEPYGMLNAPVTLLGQETGIIGPDSVVVGELARLEVAGDKVKWDCIPSILDGQAYGENGSKFVCSFREPGIYNIIAAVYINEEVQILQLPITVEGPPEPIVPDPPPTPPTPPGPPIVIIDSDLVADVASWCQGSNKNRVREVAKVFVVVADEIKRGALTTTGEIVNRTAVLNQRINLSGLNNLMSKLQTYLTTQADSGSLTTMQDHLTIWISIAQGLNQYAN